MSAPADRLPATTGWALAVAAAVGTLALTAIEPVVAPGAICGLALAAVLPRFDGPGGRVTVAAAFVPILVLVTVGVVGATGTLLATTGAVIGVVVGIATGTVLAGRGTEIAAVRAGTTAVYAGFLAGGAALFAFVVADAGGVGPVLSEMVWFAGDGASGLLLAIVVAGLAAAVGLAALPPAAFATPSRYDSYVLVRRALLSWIAVAVVFAILGLSALVVASGFARSLDSLAGAIVDSSILRTAIAIATAVGVAVAAFGLIVRYSWSYTRDRENAVVSLVVGAVPGALVPFAVALAASGGRIELVGSLFGVTAVALVVGGALTVSWAARIGSNAGFAGAFLVPVALAFGGVVVGTTVDGVAGLETIRTGAASLVALAAALFAYDVGRYGRTLAREVGRGGATREPQYVRIGWSALVAGIGVSVAVLGLGAATLLAPTLSVPATAAVVAALAAMVGGTWLLFR